MTKWTKSSIEELALCSDSGGIESQVLEIAQQFGLMQDFLRQQADLFHNCGTSSTSHRGNESDAWSAGFDEGRDDVFGDIHAWMEKNGFEVKPRPPEPDPDDYA